MCDGLIFDEEGHALIDAIVCVRFLHVDDGDVIRKLHAALSRACRCYAIRRGGMAHEKMLNMMSDAVDIRISKLRE